MNEKNKKIAKAQKVYFIIGCAIYLAALIAAVVLWLTVGHFYPLDYFVLIIAFVLPITFLLSSFFIGRSNVFGGFKWLALIFYLSAAPVVCLLIGSIDFRMGLLSGVPAIIGLVIGHIAYTVSERGRQNKEKQQSDESSVE